MAMLAFTERFRVDNGRGPWRPPWGSVFSVTSSHPPPPPPAVLPRGRLGLDGKWWFQSSVFIGGPLFSCHSRRFFRKEALGTCCDVGLRV